MSKTCINCAPNGIMIMKSRMCVNWIAANATSVPRSRPGVRGWCCACAGMKGGALAIFLKSQPSRFGAASVRLASAHVLAEQAEKLFCAAALIALQVADDDQLTRGIAAGQPQISQRVAIVGQPHELGQQRYSKTR